MSRKTNAPPTRFRLDFEKATRIFGDDGQKLLSLFSSGADGLQAMKEEARALGVSTANDAAFVLAVTGARRVFSDVDAPEKIGVPIDKRGAAGLIPAKFRKTALSFGDS